MSSEENKRLVLQFFDACARNDLDGAAALYADEGINHGMKVKREQVRMVLGDLADTFGGINSEIRTLVVDDEWAVARVEMTGEHVGKNMIPIHMLTPGTEPTGKPFSVQVIHMFRFDGGKISEHWAQRDDLGLHWQLGLIEAPGWYKARMG